MKNPLCIVCKHPKDGHSEVVACLSCACHLILADGYLIPPPVAQVSRSVVLVTNIVNEPAQVTPAQGELSL